MPSGGSATIKASGICSTQSNAKIEVHLNCRSPTTADRDAGIVGLPSALDGRVSIGPTAARTTLDEPETMSPG
jgi:hypothetical protein